MKKLRTLGFLFLSSLFVTALASCGSDTNTTNNINKGLIYDEPENYPDISLKEINESRDIRLSSVVIDTTNAKTVYYIGEEFSKEGLVVKVTYLIYENGQRVDSETRETKNYSIDYSEVDLNTVGEYPVKVSYREGTNVKEAIYSVFVKTALFETTPNITYNAGVKIGFTAANSENSLMKTIYLNDEYSFNKSQLTYDLLTKTNDENCEATLTNKTLSTRNISDNNFTTNLDVHKVGTYTIKFTYEAAEKVTINGQEYSNIVSSYVLVNVINPVISVEKVSTGDTNIVSSADKLDLSNWKFKINRKVNAGEEIVSYSDDLFILSGLNQFVTGEQTAVLTFRESTEDGNFLKVEVPISILESTTYDIYLFKDINKGMTAEYTEEGDLKGYTTKTDKEKVALDDNNIIYGYNITREYKIRECDGLNLSIRTKCNDATSYFEINMANPGKIVLYASTSGDPRSFTLVDDEGTIYEGNMLVKDAPARYEIVIEKAGVYKVKCSSSFYINGCVVAVEKTK